MSTTGSIPQKQKTKRSNIVFLFLSVLGIGRLPFSPGTFASIVSVPILFFIYLLHQELFLVLLSIFLYLLSIYFIRHTVEKPFDRNWIVIDEYLGMSVTLLPLFMFRSFSLSNAIVGLILFRFFDISKPLFVRSIDKLDTPSSVILDDLLAGFYSGLLLYIYLIIFK